MNRKMIGYYNYTVILTYLGMISACVAVFLAIGANPWLSLWFMMIAGLCDMFDGTVASTKKDRDEDQKRFGIQIDSLCDLVGFGVAPGLFVYTISENKTLSGIVAVFITLTAVIRLAYFNVLEENRQRQEDGLRKSYLGVPVTTIVLILPTGGGCSDRHRLYQSHPHQEAAAHGQNRVSHSGRRGGGCHGSCQITARGCF